MKALPDLRRRLRVLELRIEDCRGRMPAHSAKPGMMEELINLEDERDRILSEVRQSERRQTDPRGDDG